MCFKKKNKEQTKPKKVNKSKKSTSKENVQDIPENLKKHHLRVSTPYGMYPEDVDKLVSDLESQLSRLSKENKNIEELYSQAAKERDDIKAELTKLKLQVTLMEIPDTSTEEDFQMFSRLNTINPAVGSISEKVVEKQNHPYVEPIISNKIEEDEEEQEKDQDTQEVFDDLVSNKPSFKEQIGLDIIKEDKKEDIRLENRRKQQTMEHVLNLEIIEDEGGNE